MTLKNKTIRFGSLAASFDKMSSNEKLRFFSPSNQKSYRIDLTIFYVAISLLMFKAAIGYWSEIVSWCNTDNGNLAWSSILLPLQWILSIIFSKAVILGYLLSTFTWQIVYMNSSIPGVDPPSPFSPVKYRRQSGSDWHINYVFAALIGPFVTLLLALGVV